MARLRTSSPESRAAQAAMATADREAERARVIAEDYKARFLDGTATREQAAAAGARAGKLARSADSLRRAWLAERFIARVADAVSDRPELTPEQLTRIEVILQTHGFGR
ncbi:hypothetical protein GCM10017691_24180 [Pseudonocardia petroleophila]|uniref:Uncharacterized protein n=1 Tax=Pseudonocardia petroleophila TaxID=37331 RepID=A0A7G7MFS7_9PSEU|nr:hypothetical protein [Pseudonocardia petroleophila]QNG51638.1 hypothetical protein H6H00_26620 [Pseudonocardia petroleophila]